MMSLGRGLPHWHGPQEHGEHGDHVQWGRWGGGMSTELRASRRWALPPISLGGRASTLDLGMRTLKIPFPLCPRDENGSASH